MTLPTFGTLLLLVDVGFIIHAAHSGRFWPWAYVMLFLPGFVVASPKRAPSFARKQQAEWPSAAEAYLKT